MKKIMLSAAVLAFAGMTSVNAEMIKAPIATEVSVFVQDKTPVKIGDLPDAVKTTLSGDDYAGWEVKEAFAVKPAEGVAFFEISLQKEEEIKVVNLDEAGQVVELPIAAPATPTEEPTPSEEPTPAPAPSEEPAPSQPAPTE